MGSASFVVQREMKVVAGGAGYVLEDVPHLSDYISDLPVSKQIHTHKLSLSLSLAL